MTIGPEEVRHVARLAELGVQDGELERLARQLNRIVDYVAQLDRLPAEENDELFLPGPRSVTLREDVPGATPLARPPAELAPEFRDGFFLVPRHGAMEES